MELITALNQYIVENILRLTKTEEDLVAKFQEFSVEEKHKTADCVIDVLCLTLAENPGNISCRKQIHQMFEGSPNPDITRACYKANLFGIDWGWRGLPPMVK